MNWSISNWWRRGAQDAKRRVAAPAVLTLAWVCLAAAPGSAIVPCLDYESRLHWIGSLFVSDVRSLVVTPARAFGACGTAGVRFYTIPGNGIPQYTGYLDTPGTATRVCLNGSRLYVAGGTAGLQILDVAEGVTPSIIGSRDTPGSASDVTVVGNYAYVADGGSGLQIIDVTDPALPVIVGTRDTPGNAVEVLVDAGLAYVADGSSGLQILDVSNPAAPIIIGAANTPGSANGLALSGHQVVVADWSGGVQVVDVSQPGAPAIMSAIATSRPVQDVVVDGDRAFATCYANNLTPYLLSVDISDPHLAVQSAQLPMEGEPRGIFLLDQRAYVAAYETIEVFDVTSGEGVAPISSVALPGAVSDLSIVGHLACVAVGEAGLVLVDVTDPGALQIVGQSGSGTPAASVCASGTRAFTLFPDWSVQASILRAYDITNPAAPVQMGSISLDGQWIGLQIRGDYVYAVSQTAVAAVNVSTPSQMQVGGGVGATWALELTMGDAHAYVVDWHSGILVLDLADPANPVTCGVLPGSAPEQISVGVEGERAFAISDNRLQAYGVATPCTATRGRDTSASTGVSEIVVRGDFLYAANKNYGFQVFDIADLAAPRIVGSVEPGSFSFGGVEAVDDFLVFAAYTGLATYPLQCGTTTAVEDPPLIGTASVLNVSPNPLSTRGRISLAIAASGVIALDVYDLAGRHVRTLHRGVEAAGEFSLTWNGDDDQGRRVGAGVYLVRAKTPGADVSRRVVVLQ